MKYKIKLADASDIEKGLLDVYIEGYRYHQKGRPDAFVDVSNNDLEKDLLNILQIYEVLVILDDDKVVGYLAYEIREKRINKLVIQHLIIKKEYRNKGLGKMLVDEAFEYAKKCDCDVAELNCWMFNENAISMYKHIGFDEQRIILEKKLK